MTVNHDVASSSLASGVSVKTVYVSIDGFFCYNGMMKSKKIYQLYASFGLVLFVMLGYLVKFFPSSLFGFDTDIQSLIRGQMSTGLTSFFKLITDFGGKVYTPIIVALVVCILLLKKWYAESIFLVISVAGMPIIVSILKHIYGRIRPSVPHLVVENGFSFPSGHASTSLMLYAWLMVLICQRLKSKQIRFLMSVLGTIFIILIGISRIYLGVHFPSDILGGWLLSGSVILLIFPFYDEIRFKWRFKGVQK